MSNLVFDPLLPYGYSVFKIPTWATRTQRAMSGRELRRPDYANPIWNFRLTFEILRDRQIGEVGGGGLTSEIRRLMDFFNQLSGAYDTFLYADPTDFSVVDESLGTGDGARTEFQLVRRLYGNGFPEAIIAPHAITNVKVNGSVTAAYTLDSNTGIITFTSAPAAAATITATFTFYFRCNMMTDLAEFENMLVLRWRLGELRFKSVIL